MAALLLLPVPIYAATLGLNFTWTGLPYNSGPTNGNVLVNQATSSPSGESNLNNVLDFFTPAAGTAFTGTFSVTGTVTGNISPFSFGGQDYGFLRETLAVPTLRSGSYTITVTFPDAYGSNQFTTAITQYAFFPSSTLTNEPVTVQFKFSSTVFNTGSSPYSLTFLPQ